MDDLRLHGVIGSGIKRKGDNVALASEVSGTTLKLVPPKGVYDGETAKVTITDANFLESNIKLNVNIFDKIGNKLMYGKGDLLTMSENVVKQYDISQIIKTQVFPKDGTNFPDAYLPPIIEPNGYVYVITSSNTNFGYMRFNVDGTLNSYNYGLWGTIEPKAAAFNKFDNHLYVAFETTIKVYDIDMNLVKNISPTLGTSKFVYLYTVQFDFENEKIVAIAYDSTITRNRIMIIDLNGSILKNIDTTASYSPRWNYSGRWVYSSIKSDYIYISSGNYVYCYQISTNTFKWEKNIGYNGFTTIIPNLNKLLVFGNLDGTMISARVSSLDLDTGSMGSYLSFASSSMDWSAVTRIVMLNDTLMAATVRKSNDATTYLIPSNFKSQSVSDTSTFPHVGYSNRVKGFDVGSTDGLFVYTIKTSYSSHNEDAALYKQSIKEVYKII